MIYVTEKSVSDLVVRPQAWSSDLRASTLYHVGSWAALVFTCRSDNDAKGTLTITCHLARSSLKSNPSVIEGVTVSGYAITPSRQSIEQGIRAEIATGELSPAAQQQLQQATKTFSGFTLDVWFDGSGLMHRMSVDMRASGPPSTDAHVVMTFQDYGTPVNVSPPPSGQVISYSAFLAALQSEQTPPT